ncbi:MAG: DoxX family protein [Bacteroidales bacterium]
MFRKIVYTSAPKAILLIRFAAIPLTVIMLVALFTTKADIFSQQGFWEMMHASRTDWAMLLGSLFLIFMGPGQWSLDRRLFSDGRA